MVCPQNGTAVLLITARYNVTRDIGGKQPGTRDGSILAVYIYTQETVVESPTDIW